MVEMDDKTESAGFKCDKCSSSFARKDNLKRHTLRVHKEEYVDNVSKTQCLFPGCEKQYYHKVRMLQHLEEDHGIDLQIEKLEFNTLNDFYSWKEEEEARSFVYFSKQYGNSKSKKSDVSYYMCQRDGSSRAHKKNGQLARKSTRRNKKGVIKTGYFCPARMVVSVSLDSGGVSVKYIKSHNHVISLQDIQHHPIPASVKEGIKNKLSVGIAADKVYKDWQQKRETQFIGSQNTNTNNDDGQRHNQGMIIPNEDIKEECAGWKVLSQSNDIVYFVTKLNDVCNTDHCFSKCLDISCLGLCGHLYYCTCEDKSDLCKHIHKVHSSIIAYKIDGNDQDLDESGNDQDLDDSLYGTVQFFIKRNDDNGETINDLSVINDQLDTITELVIHDSVKTLLLPHIKGTLHDLILQCEEVVSSSCTV